MYSEILDKIIPSKDIREHLKNGGLENSVDYIEEIIFSAPIPIKEKYDLITQLYEDIRKKDNKLEYASDEAEEYVDYRYAYRIERYENFIAILNIALEQQQKKGIFVVENGDYDWDRNDVDYSFECIFETYDEAIEWIHEQIRINEYTSDDTIWFAISSWVKNDVGKYEQICGYEIINGVACYTWIDRKISEKNKINHFVDFEINIEVPFVAGDIIEINGTPFCPKYRALVTSVGDNIDCCCIQVMTCGNDDVWQIGALKHNFVAMRTYPFISPLYTAVRYYGELEPDEMILKELQSFINGSEKRGGLVNDMLFTEDRTVDELKEFLKNQKDV